MSTEAVQRSVSESLPGASEGAGAAAPRRRLPTRLKWLVFLLLWPTYGYFYQSAGHNEAARLDQARAIVEDGVLWVDRYSFNSADLIEYERGGVRHVYSGKAPGATLVAALPLKLWSLALGILRLPDWIHWHLVVYLTVVSTVGLLSALAAVVMLGMVWRLTSDPVSSVLAVVAVWLGSIVFPFSTLMFGHQLAAASLTLAFALLFRVRWEGISSLGRPRLALGAAGLLAGFGVVIEYPTVLLVALLSAYLLHVLRGLESPRRVGWALLGCYAAGGAVAGGVLVAHNLAAFGTPFYVPYEAYLGGPEAERFPAHAKGFLGIHWPGAPRFLDVLAEITVRPRRGLLYLGFERWRVYALNPVLWLAVPGLGLLLARRDTRAEGLLVASLTAAFLTFNACYGDSIVYWGGGASVGPRHLVPVLPFLALPLALAVRRLWWLLVPLLLVSVFYMLLATAVEPRVGYGFRNPARDLFATHYMAGSFGLSRSGLFDAGRRLLTEDSVAFNLGKLAGLPGAWQLAPLMAWWFTLGTLLIRSAAPARARSETPGGAAGAAGWRGRMAAALRPRRPGPRGAATFALGAFVAFTVLAPSLHRRIVAPRAGQAGLVGRYYPNAAWTGEPARVRVDPRIDFNWLEPPWPLPPPFSIEWTGTLRIERAGRYAFFLDSDDGSVLEIDGRVVVDNGGSHGVRTRGGSVELAKGAHDVRIRYFNELFGGMVRLHWHPPDGLVGTVPGRLLSPGAGDADATDDPPGAQEPGGATR